MATQKPQKATIVDSATSLPVDFSAAAPVVGAAAHDAPISGAPMRMGARARNSNLDQVANDDAVDLMASRSGALVTRDWCVTDRQWQYSSTSAITSSAAVTLAAAGTTNRRNYLNAIQLINVGGTASVVCVRDGSAGAVIWSVYLPANMTIPVSFEFPIPVKTTALTLMQFTVETSGASVYMSAQGHGDI